MFLLLVVICIAVGLLIGAVGIGGVLLVPSMALLVEIEVHRAIPACMLAYLATGVVGGLVYARHGSIRWKRAGWLCAGAVPAAFAGSLALPYLPADAILAIIALLMIVSGADALRKAYAARPATAAKREPGTIQFVVIGFVTGFGSAVTGTGGPLILVPTAIYLGLPVLSAVGLSQVIQVPIALFASAGHWLSGNLDLHLALVIAAAMVVGTLAGAGLAHRIPGEPLRKLIAYLLVVVGVGIGLRLLLG